jgi:hypothetical protein
LVLYAAGEASGAAPCASAADQAPTCLTLALPEAQPPIVIRAIPLLRVFRIFALARFVGGAAHATLTVIERRYMGAPPRKTTPRETCQTAPRKSNLATSMKQMGTKMMQTALCRSRAGA